MLLLSCFHSHFHFHRPFRFSSSSAAAAVLVACRVSVVARSSPSESCCVCRWPNYRYYRKHVSYRIISYHIISCFLGIIHYSLIGYRILDAHCLKRPNSSFVSFSSIYTIFQAVPISILLTTHPPRQKKSTAKALYSIPF